MMRSSGLIVASLIASSRAIDSSDITLPVVNVKFDAPLPGAASSTGIEGLKQRSANVFESVASSSDVVAQFASEAESQLNMLQQIFQKAAHGRSASLLSLKTQDAWPVEYTAAADNMPIIDLRLEPPRNQLNALQEVAAKLSSAREQKEQELMHEFDAATASAAEGFLSKISASAARHMGSSKRAASTGFREGEPSFSAQVNLLESTAPSSSLARDLERMEKKRDLDAANLVNEAIRELPALVTLVQNEFESEVQRHLSGASRRTSFLARQSDAAAADVTNVRVHAGDAFASVAGIARDLEGKRDASEAAMRRQILEKEAQVLRRASLQALDALKARVEETLHSA